MKRGQVGQTITFVPVFILTILLMFLFVAISAGFCLVGKCSASETSKVEIVNNKQIESRVLGEMFLSGDIRELIVKSKSASDSEKIEIIETIEREFEENYGCNGENILVIAKLERFNYNDKRTAESGEGVNINPILVYPKDYEFDRDIFRSREGYFNEGYWEELENFGVLFKGSVKC